jgi:hypothetical protein
LASIDVQQIEDLTLGNYKLALSLEWK